ncbi:MAG: hypothetical protein M1830_003693 [Pleopsidium flavum]|nr:MAG: hypothetical protein M1830_003693 [Pleopsidium flavum]
MHFNVPWAVLAFLFVGFNTAMPWFEPIQTPTGLMAAIGFSPLPTEAPGLGSIPKELLRRQNSVPYPPPNNWCGFVGGDPADVLSCVATKSCVYSGAVLGCCDAGLIATCTNLFTTCANYGDTCNSACEANNNILKCSNAAIPYCGTFAFDAGTRLYNCDSTAGFAKSVEFLADYYLTAIGSQILSSTFGPVSITAASQSIGGGSNKNSAVATSASGTAINNVGVQTNPPTASPTSRSSSSGANSSGTSSHSGFGTGAIVGVVVGILVVLLAIIIGLIAWCLIRRRRRRANLAPSQAPPPQMQQHQMPVQTQGQGQVPTYPPQQPTYPPTQQQQGYFPTPQEQQQQKPVFSSNGVPLAEAGAGTVEGGVGAGAGYHDSKPNNADLSPPLNGPPRYSVASTGQNQGPGTGTGTGNEYFKAPTSPTVTEVEGSGMNTPAPPGAISPLTTGQGGYMGVGQGQGHGQGYGHGQEGQHGYGQGGQGYVNGFNQGQGYAEGQGQGQMGHGGNGAYEISGSQSGMNARPVGDIYEIGERRL